jgi:hypothetical protein
LRTIRGSVIHNHDFIELPSLQGERLQVLTEDADSVMSDGYTHYGTSLAHRCTVHYRTLQSEGNGLLVRNSESERRNNEFSVW